jgi:hypothetical protein
MLLLYVVSCKLAIDMDGITYLPTPDLVSYLACDSDVILRIACIALRLPIYRG